MKAKKTVSSKIDYLGRYAEFTPVIAQWHQDEWHNISPDLSTESRISLYNSYENKSAIPCCFIAIVDNQPAGSASLITCDMADHPHLSPWLASVYVHEKYRCHGVASQLMNRCIEQARQLNTQTLYLFTPHQTHFYLKHGWKIIESCLYEGEHVDIMSYDLTELAPKNYE